MPNDYTEDGLDKERQALSGYIEEGYLQAVRRELIDASKAQREIQTMKNIWRQVRGQHEI